MESLAKIITQCDNCKAALNKKEDVERQNIQATLTGGDGKDNGYHFCDENCLRVFLNCRAKRNRSMASTDCLEIEFPIIKK